MVGSLEIQTGQKRSFDELKFLKCHPVLDTGSHKLVLAIAGQARNDGFFPCKWRVFKLSTQKVTFENFEGINE